MSLEYLESDLAKPQEITSFRRHGYKSSVEISGNAHVQFGDVITVLRSSSSPEESKTLNIRRALYFQTMNHRKAQLEAANIASFEWIRDSNLHSFLACEEGRFWICGKPASGKSTLMRYLAGSDYLFKTLPPRDRSWQIIDFYFDFRAGDGIANTPTGMLRTLLFQLVEKSTEITDFLHRKYSDIPLEDWVDKEVELRDAVYRSLQQAKIPVCALIDGLDEYGGKAKDLAACLLDLQACTGMKVLLASRPELMLKRCFGTLPTLLIQDHNQETIRSYVSNATTILHADEAESLGPLFDTIEREARGVILWVKFVTDELVERKISGDTTSELNEILRMFPRELEDIYLRKLLSLDLRRRIHAAIVLQLLRQNRLLTTSELFNLWSIAVEKVDPESNFDEHFDFEQFLNRLYALLGGLLDISAHPQQVRSGNPGGITDNEFELPRISLIHKTLSSFLDRSRDFKMLLDSHLIPVLGSCSNNTLCVALFFEANKALQIDVPQLATPIIRHGRTQEYGNPYPTLMEDLKTRVFPVNWTYRLLYLMRISRYMPFDFFDNNDPTEIKLTLERFRQPLLLLHGAFPPQGCCDCEWFEFSPDLQVEETWYLDCLLSHGLWSAAEAGVREHKDLLSPTRREVLIGIIDKVLKKREGNYSHRHNDPPKEESKTRTMRVKELLQINECDWGERVFRPTLPLEHDAFPLIGARKYYKTYKRLPSDMEKIL